jgi:hypothetical protein
MCKEKTGGIQSYGPSISSKSSSVTSRSALPGHQCRNWQKITALAKHPMAYIYMYINIYIYIIHQTKLASMLRAWSQKLHGNPCLVNTCLRIPNSETQKSKDNAVKICQVQLSQVFRLDRNCDGSPSAQNPLPRVICLRLFWLLQTLRDKKSWNIWNWL